jgi:hypothetical protein
MGVSWNDERLDDLNGRVAGLSGETRCEFRSVRNDVRDEARTTRSEMRDEVRDLRCEIRNLRREMNERLLRRKLW